MEQSVIGNMVQSDIIDENEGRLLMDEATEIVLEDFSNPMHKWGTMEQIWITGSERSQKNSLIIENGTARFTGVCEHQLFLDAPGPITMVTGGSSMAKESFPDVSRCQALELILRTNVDFPGYHVSFGKPLRSDQGYRAPLSLTKRQDYFEIVRIPFTDFSSKWDAKTGDISVTCAEDPTYCPTKEWLSNLQTISFWGQGAEGAVDLEIQLIQAIGCSPPSSLSAPTNSATETDNNGNGVAVGVGIGMGLLVLAFLAGFTMLVRRLERQAEDDYEPPKRISASGPIQLQGLVV